MLNTPTLWDHLYDDFFFNVPRRKGINSVSSLSDFSVHDTEDALVLSLDMPGVNEENISLTIDNQNYLRVEATRKTASEDFRINKAYKVPANINVDDIQAQYSNGVLEVSLPKSTPDMKKIPIKESSDQKLLDDT